MISITLVLVVIIFSLSFYAFSRPRHFPPGPIWWPLLGTLPQIRLGLTKWHLHRIFQEWAREYGPVVGLRLGIQPMVLVSGIQTTRLVLSSDAFDARPDGFFFRLRTFGHRQGVVFAEGESWREMRRFVVHQLRDSTHSKRCEQEALSIIKRLMLRADREGYLVPKVHDLFKVAVLNTLWALIAGNRLPEGDPRLDKLLMLVDECFRFLDVGGGLLNQMPLLRFVMPQTSGYTLIMRTLNSMWKFIQITINEHKKKEESCSKNLIDAFLKKQNEGKNGYTEQQLVSVCMDLFMAGAETTATTISMALLYLLKFPELQIKIRKELDAACPNPQEWPSWQTRTRTPFLEAFLNEVHRHASIAPLGIAHRTSKEVKLEKYIIPKDTLVVVSLWSVHRDPHFWTNPEDFNPDRFLDENGKLISSSDAFLPFGFGKRRCLGESLARVNIFVFISMLLCAFEIHPDDKPLPPTLGLDGLTLATPPFSAKFVPRRSLP